MLPAWATGYQDPPSRWAWESCGLERGQLNELLTQDGEIVRLTVNMVDLLVGNPAIVLQNVEVLRSNGGSNLLCNGKELCEGVVGDVCELLAVELGNDKLMAQPGQYGCCLT